MASLLGRRVVQNGLPQNIWFPVETQTRVFLQKLHVDLAHSPNLILDKEKKKPRGSSCGFLLITDWLQCLLTRSTQKLQGNHPELSMPLIFRYPCPHVISRVVQESHSVLMGLHASSWTPTWSDVTWSLLDLSRYREHAWCQRHSHPFLGLLLLAEQVERILAHMEFCPGWSYLGLSAWSGCLPHVSLHCGGQLQSKWEQ